MVCKRVLGSGGGHCSRYKFDYLFLPAYKRKRRARSKNRFWLLRLDHIISDLPRHLPLGFDGLDAAHCIVLDGRDVCHKNLEAICLHDEQSLQDEFFYHRLRSKCEGEAMWDAVQRDIHYNLPCAMSSRGVSWRWTWSWGSPTPCCTGRGAIGWPGWCSTRRSCGPICMGVYKTASGSNSSP